MGLRCLWRTFEGRCGRKRWREEEGRGVEGAQKIRDQQENQLVVSLALAFNKSSETKDGDRIRTIHSEGQRCIRCVICYLSS